MPLWGIALIVVGVAVLGIVAHKLGLIDLRGSRRTSGSSGVVGIGDEVFNPTRHEAQVELDRQTILPAPTPLAGDDDKGIYGGTVRIDL
jgi:hypothetical protein